MNKQEAIKTLREWRGRMADHGVPDFGEKYKALGMAIEALQDDWIPVSERVPEKSGYYIVSLNDAVDSYASFGNGKWYYVAFDLVLKEYREHEVIAWKPLPEPYKGGDDNE